MTLYLKEHWKYDRSKLKVLFLLSKLRSLDLCPLAILMPLEKNHYKVPHLKALISGLNISTSQMRGSTLRGPTLF